MPLEALEAGTHNPRIPPASLATLPRQFPTCPLTRGYARSGMPSVLNSSDRFRSKTMGYPVAPLCFSRSKHGLNGGLR